jgi:hypothetical protein
MPIDIPREIFKANIPVYLDIRFGTIFIKGIEGLEDVPLEDKAARSIIKSWYNEHPVAKAKLEHIKKQYSVEVA